MQYSFGERESIQRRFGEFLLLLTSRIDVLVQTGHWNGNRCSSQMVVTTVLKRLQS